MSLDLRWRIRWTCGLPVLAVLLASACTSSEEEPEPVYVDYNHTVAPLVARYCNICHQEGGIGPFALTDYTSLKTVGAVVRDSVEAGRMPPWLPSDKGVPLRYSRAMSPEHRELLLRWIDEGMREDDPRAVVPSGSMPDEIPLPARSDLIISPGEAYEPDTTAPDDMRCFVIDPQLDADTFFQAGTVVPGNGKIVHHVAITEIPEANAAEFLQRDMDEPGPGYNCWGEIPDQRTILFWVPGSVPVRAPAGTAMKVSRGALFLMEVHYNSVNYDGVPDLTTFHLERSDIASPVPVEIVSMGNPLTFELRAGDADAHNGHSVPVSRIQSVFGLPGNELTIFALNGHMHVFGKSITISRENGPVILDIPRYDTHWQEGYTLVEPLVLQSDDVLSVSCVHDNSAENQPVINGMKQAPRDVAWGWGSYENEMCIATFGLFPGPPPQ